MTEWLAYRVQRRSAMFYSFFNNNKMLSANSFIWAHCDSSGRVWCFVKEVAFLARFFVLSFDSCIKHFATGHGNYSVQSYLRSPATLLLPSDGVSSSLLLSLAKLPQLSHGSSRPEASKRSRGFSVYKRSQCIRVKNWLNIFLSFNTIDFSVCKLTLAVILKTWYIVRDDYF